MGPSPPLVLFPDNSAALFKIANGEDIASAPAPGMFDLKVRLPVLPLDPPSRSQDQGRAIAPPPRGSSLPLTSCVFAGVQGKAKKNAWQKKVDEDVTQEGAKEQYVALVEKLKTQYGYDANKEPEAVGN